MSSIANSDIPNLFTIFLLKGIILTEFERWDST